MKTKSRFEINPVVEEKIRARVLDALAAGWELEELWESRFWPPPGCRRGLASCMRPEQEIGEITPEYIEVYRDDISRGRITLKFYKRRN